MLDKIIDTVSKFFNGKSLVNTKVSTAKTDTDGNTVINNGDDNVTAIGNNITVDVSPKIKMEKNESANSEDDYTLCIDTKNKSREKK